MRNKSHNGKLRTARRSLLDSARSMPRLFAGFFAVVLFCASAYGSCIVSGDTTRDSAVSVPSVLASPGWFDSSWSSECITNPLNDFDSFPPGIILIVF